LDKIANTPLENGHSTKNIFSSINNKIKNMQTKNLLKALTVIAILTTIVINACKKKDKTVANNCVTTNNLSLKFNGTAWSPLFSSASQNSSTITLGNFSDITSDGFALILNKSGLVQGQTYNQSILAGSYIYRGGVGYTITTAQITVITYTSNCFKMSFAMTLASGATTATITEGVLEAPLP
jgi:hypothetical protein